MKKQDNKKKNVTKSVDSQLGTFGIDPPKLYRENQRRQSRNETARRKKPSSQKQMSTGERRQKQVKGRKRKRIYRKIVLIIVLIVLALVAIIVPSLTVFFSIDNVDVSGSKIYSKAQIKTACTIDSGENLWLADTAKATAKLEESLPYVYTATVTRKLPGTIVIKIKDATAAYSIDNGNGTYTLLDDNFKVLENGASDKGSTIAISMAQIKSATAGKKIEFSNAKVSSCLIKLASAIKSNEFSEATGIYSEGLNSNYIVYDNRIKFKLGACDNLESKIYQGLAACDEMNSSNPTATGTLNLTGDKTIYFTDE